MKPDSYPLKKFSTGWQRGRACRIELGILTDMDNKKLMQILLRDVQELEKLIVEIEQDGHFDKLDMELLHTRITGVRHLLEVFTEMKHQPAPVQATYEPRPSPQAPVGEKTAPPVIPVVPAQAPPPAPEPVKAVAPVTAEPETSLPTRPVASAETPSEKSSQGEIRFVEEVETHPEKQILGEKFTAGKSLHDLLAGDKNNNDSRFTLPITSLASAIGTNDRFLFTRELFDGNMDHFHETIHSLDGMKTIQEAVDFLQEHFQWKKSETTHKFLELVKRRFL